MEKYELENRIKELELNIREIKKRSEFFQVISDHSVDWELFRNPEGKVLYCNKAFEQITGYSIDEFLNGKISEKDLAHPDDWVKVVEQMQKTVKTNESETDIEFRIVTKNKQIRTVNLCSQPVFQNNLLLGFRTSIRDVTDNKINLSLKISEEKFKLIFEKSIAPIMVADDKGNYLAVNKATAEIFEYSINELIHMNVGDIITNSNANAVSQYEEYIRKGEETGEFSFVSKNGTAKIVKYKAVRIKPDFNVSILMDITEQKVALEELTKAKIQAEEAMNSKQQFLSNMSHEIRTPMIAIIGFSKVALKTDLTEKQKEYITAIKTSSDALLVLINDILDLAKVDAGKMTFEQNVFEMENNISAMLHLFDLKIQEKNLECTIEYDTRIPKVLIGDSVRLNQILLNLMSNAIKFTSKGKITMSVRLVASSEEKVSIEFAVADTGIGVAENMIPKLFESFQQATSSTARRYGGTGLGLAIVKQLVELQGGTISVESKLNEGSTFSFILSFKKTNKEIESELPISELIPEIKKIKILAVEDVPLNQLLLKIILDEFGFQRDFAENGKVAIEKLQSDTYDIVLMDLQMPEMNGLEATEYIRKKMNSKIPIIALTADVTMDDLEKCKAIGMNDHISKPIDEKLLYNKIVELVIK